MGTVTLAATVILAVMEGQPTCAPDSMVKMVIKDLSPGVAAGSRAAQPKTIYRLGTNYGRIEESSDPMIVLTIVSLPDLWDIEMIPRIGAHFVDTSAEVIMPIFIFGEPGDPDLIARFEFGCELDYITRKSVNPPQSVTLDGHACLCYEATEGEYSLSVYFDLVTLVPRVASVRKRGAVRDSIQYLDYETGLVPDLQLFVPPADVKLTEGW